MNLNSDELAIITKMAGLFFTPREIAINLQVTEADLREHIAKHGSDIEKAYSAGIILGDIKLRTGIMQAAEHGSNPAQVLMLKIKEDSEVQSKIDE